jgi:hypothetical protein
VIEEGVELAEHSLQSVDGAAEAEHPADCVLVMGPKGVNECLHDALVIVADQMQGINGPVD